MSVTKTQSQIIPGATCWSCKAALAARPFLLRVRQNSAAAAQARTISRFSDCRRNSRLTRSRSKSEFHKLSWKLHPDNFTRATEHERNLSLERSSQLNDAYRTLRDPLARVEYLLLRLGLRKEGATKQQAPPELLEEVFEFNESLDELREARAEGGDVASLRANGSSKRKIIFKEKLGEVDEELAAVAPRMGCNARRQRERHNPKRPSRSHERNSESPQLHPESGSKRAKRIGRGLKHGTHRRNRSRHHIQPDCVSGPANGRAEVYPGPVRFNSRALPS